MRPPPVYRMVIYDAAVPSIDEFALYRPDRDGSAGGVAIPGPFDAVRYSRYKYGSTVAAGWFARALGQAFLYRYARLAHQPRLLIASSPYRRVPTAANALAVRFAAVLNAARAGRGLPPAPLVHIERMAASSGDYGTLSTEARTRLMAVNALSFDRLRPLADGAHLIVVDDVKVTGAHQRCLISASETLPLGSRAFVHIAAFDSVGAQRLDPALEDRLNHAIIATLDDLAGLVRESDFTWNVRVCKFLLCPASRGDLPSFLIKMSDRFVRELRHNSFIDGYARMDAYRESHGIVQRELRRRDRLRASPRRPASPAMASLPH
jgi:PRTase ComF-like